MRRILWTATEWLTLKDHFERAADTEAGAFLLVRTGRSTDGVRLLVQRVLLPPDGGFERQGPDFLRPTGQWLSSAIGAALEARCGLAFIHSHPNAYHPLGLSPIDLDTSITWAKTIGPMLDGPFASLVWSPQGITGIMFSRGQSQAPLTLNRAEILGRGAVERLHRLDDRPNDLEIDDRQARALSVIGNRRLREFQVGVVGAGGTGSPLAEQLIRVGVARVTLVDPDSLDSPSNLRRVVGSRPSDLRARRNKAEVVGRHLDSLDLSTKVDVLPIDVRCEDAIRSLLDCDIVLNTTDTHSSRAFLNQIAYQYWVPLIDVGVRIGTSRYGAISGMPVEIRVLLPDNGCLWCRGNVLDGQTIYEENLPPDKRERLAREGYVQGFLEAQPSLAPLNYFASSLALLALVRLYSGQTLPSVSTVFDGWEQYVHPLTAEIRPECVCSKWRGMGDSVPIAFHPGGETT